MLAATNVLYFLNCENNFLSILSYVESSFLINLILPIDLIFLTLNFFKNFLVSKFCGYAMSIRLNIEFEKLFILYQRLKVFCVILAFNKISGILFFFYRFKHTWPNFRF